MVPKTLGARVEPTVGSSEHDLVARFGRTFVDGEALFREGDAATHAYLLESGRVRLARKGRGFEPGRSSLGPGELLGESAIAADAEHEATAVALTPGVAISLDRDGLRFVIAHHPAVAFRVMEQLGARAREARERLEIVSLRDHESKVAFGLLKLASSGSSPPPAPDGTGPSLAQRAEIHVSPAELSARVGVDVDTVKQVVRRLRAQHHVRVAGDTIEIEDVASFRKFFALLSHREPDRGADVARSFRALQRGA
jgi:CRP/FNR family cyclic AMP-dependent transcriptional regulator